MGNAILNADDALEVFALQQVPQIGEPIFAASSHAVGGRYERVLTMPERPDIAAGAFLALRQEFFTPTLRPRSFGLRDKRNTQDDPLDAHITQRLDHRMPKALRVVGASGPLISPDLIIAFPPGVQDMQKGGSLGTSDLVGIEVKKLERDKHGRIARPGGLDYNSTPPSKTIAAYHDGDRIELPGFYLFVCLEREARRKYKITAMALCDGGVLNEDVDLYAATIGQREKQIGLGSYGDGLDRQRPMLVFPNPLGWSELDGEATLIHRSAELGDSRLIRVGKIRRARPSAGTKKSAYFVYRDARDAKEGGEFDEFNPFPSVARRSSKTQPRGRFHIRFP